MVTNMSGFIAPSVTGAVLARGCSGNEKFPLSASCTQQWRLAFWLGAVVSVVGIVIFEALGHRGYERVRVVDRPRQGE